MGLRRTRLGAASLVFFVVLVMPSVYGAGPKTHGIF
jgi:hypothetical protein